MFPSSEDVILVGAGHAAFCPALAAAERGVSIPRARTGVYRA
jgi:succinate dehydrogenase/fumarate reductase flavoprotein subunit